MYIVLRLCTRRIVSECLFVYFHTGTLAFCTLTTDTCPRDCTASEDREGQRPERDAGHEARGAHGVYSVLIALAKGLSIVNARVELEHLVVGTLQGVAGDLRKEARYAFNYSAHEPRSEISLTMPVRAESYPSGALLPIFEMNWPERYLLNKIEEAFAKAGGLDEMRLLDIVGGEQIGRWH